MRSHPVEAHAWPMAALTEALATLAERLRPLRRIPRINPLSTGELDDSALSALVEDAAGQLGLEVESVDARATTGRSLLGMGGPVMVVRPGEPRVHFLVLLGRDRRGRWVEVLAPDRKAYRLAMDDVDAWLDHEQRGPSGQGFRRVCAQVGLSSEQQEHARQILGGAAGPGQAAVGWILHPMANTLRERLVQAGAPRVLGAMLVFFLLAFMLMIGSWWLLGAAALQGHLERGWLWAWAILLLTFVVARSGGVWAAGRLAVQLGGLVRERLLDGILRMPADQVRVKGVGHLLGTVLEADALDALARTGGPTLVADLFQFLLGAAVLLLGEAPFVHAALMLVWLAVAVWFVRRLSRKLMDWADARLALTDEIVETMVGHRTLVVQKQVEQLRADDQRGLDTYARKQAALDNMMALLGTVLPRGWLILGVAALVPSFVTGAAQSAGLAVSLGGVLLVYFAFRRVALETGPGLAAAFVGWRRTRSLFMAAAEKEEIEESVAVLPSEVEDASAGRHGLLVARDVTFSYPGRLDPVLRGCNVEIHRGERILLEGPSGSGKSTLGALLCGLRQPTGGLLLLGGFDQHSLPARRWRQRAASVPQSHENHILSAPLLFNVAMARRWPPHADDQRDVEEICRELGFSDLLARMPTGIQQMVGDSGWQLSHGERSRLCVARALMQPAEIRVLDESFAALDPETLDRVLECVVRRSPTLIVVSHT